MIRAYHAIFTAYGFWLPNDPRGSWSDFVRSWELLRFGAATMVTTRRSLARRQHNAAQRLAAKRALRYPPVVFTGQQALAIARGFETAVAQSGYIVHACSILPEHVHMVVARHPQNVGVMIGHFKVKATEALGSTGLRPPAPCPWARRGWHVFLDTVADMRRAIRYVQENPMREGKRRQTWRFVIRYDGGPPMMRHLRQKRRPEGDR